MKLDPVTDLARPLAPLSPRGRGRVKPGAAQADEEPTAMPYERDEDLPAAVQKLAKPQRETWRRIFNGVLDSAGDEQKAFAIAWAKVNGDREAPDDAAT